MRFQAPSASACLALAAFVLVPSASAWAAVSEPGFIERQIVSGLSNPTALTFAPDGRLFVCQQGGALRVIKNGTLLTTPFVSLTVDANGERGLLGVAFDPDFATTAHVFVYYTVPGSPPHNRVSRFTAAGDVAVPGSEAVIMELDNLSSATNHNGGAIHFGPDGRLYVAVGDNANGANAQTLANRHGKVLRINKDGSIPTDNPFYGTAVDDDRSIWALGLRNPFTFAFSGDGTRMYVNDVGQNTWEEINGGVAGANYGWPSTEGPISPPDPAFTGPLYAYQHGAGTPTGCAIVGGAFHDPAKVDWPASFDGDYFFADLCSNFIRRFDPASPGSSVPFATGITTPVDLTIGPEGDLYALTRGVGLRRFSTDFIFGDGVEGGDASEWSAAATDGGDLSVTSAAALGSDSDLGLEANVNDTAPLFVVDDRPNDENRYRARFHFDPNGFDPGEAQGRLRLRLFHAFEEAPVLRRLVTVVLRRSQGAYAVSARVRLDNGTTADTPFVPVTDAPHVVEFDWRRSTSVAAPNGSFTLRVDGAVASTLSGLDNDSRAVDFARLGAMAVKPGALGTLYFDEFVSYREGPAGPLP
jgi:glucose/arabinose dehydrogenase